MIYQELLIIMTYYVILNAKRIVKNAVHMEVVKNGRRVSMGQGVMLGAQNAVILLLLSRKKLSMS